MMNFIPVFPLSLVVFPGESLNLHIFEPRYRQLIRECSETGKPFGIPVVMDNRLRDIGTLVEVLEISKTYEDGKMDIRCRGISVFRMLEFIAEVPDKLYSGAIVEYPPNDLTARPRLVQKVKEGLQQLHALLKISKPLPDKGLELLSYDLAHHLGLALEAEYELLAHFDERQRLELLRRHLQKALPIVSGMEALKERVKLNGHFRDSQVLDSISKGTRIEKILFRQINYMKTLCLDFGNTRMKYALFEQDRLLETEALPDGDTNTMQTLLFRHRPNKAILSSVIKHDPAIESMMADACQFHKLSHETKLPITVPVGKPEEMGADRLALAAAAVHYFPGKNNLVIGLGTAITYNFINQYNQFIGGAISPGMEMRFKSLRDYTALLPLVQKAWDFPLVGYDTRTNILSGVVMGMAKEIDGMIDAHAEKYDNFNVVLTGGDNGYFASLLKNRIFADSDFLFKGLYAISETNNKL